MEDIINPPEIKEKEELVDVNLDIGIDLGIDLDIDDLETIRFESVPEKKQTQTSIPIIDECSVFGWLFMCFI